MVGIGVLVQFYEPQRNKEQASSDEQALQSDRKFVNEKGEKWGPLPEGEYVFQVISAENAQPKFLEGVVDPPDVHVGDIQKFRIVVQSPAGINSVIANIETDNGTTTVPLEMTGEETWEGEWQVKDTHDTFYHTIFVARDAADRENSITIAWSDACGIPISGNWTTTANCTISSTDGVDNGNVTIQTYTLTLNAAFARNPGRSVSINSGSIVIGSSGQLREAYLYMADSDSDGYPANSTQYTGSASGRRRRSVLTSYTTDCYDSNSNAKPGQSSYFTTHRGDGSFDYNCDGSQTKRYTQTGGRCENCSSEARKEDSKFFATLIEDALAFQHFPNGNGECFPLGVGGTGWSGSAPGCGSSATYYTNPGDCMIDGCPWQAYGCNWVTRTQQCR